MQILLLRDMFFVLNASSQVFVVKLFISFRPDWKGPCVFTERYVITMFACNIFTIIPAHNTKVTSDEDDNDDSKV